MTELAQQTMHPEEKKCQAHRIANDLFQQEPDWVTFFREVLGVDGIVRRLFPTQEELFAFEQTDEYAEIQQMLAKLRLRKDGQMDNREPTRVITVRMPQSLHASLQREAHDRSTSMNKLCISKLLQVIDEELIPTGQTATTSQSSMPQTETTFE